MHSLLLLGLLLLPTAALAQQGPDRVLTGRVVDATTDLPVPGASVWLERANAAGGTRATQTDVAGVYVFAAVAPGRFRLTVQRAGYLARSIDVELSGSDSTRVSVALEVAPIALEPLSVTARAEQPYHAASGRESGAAGEIRIAAEKRRQQQYLEPDVRVLTEADVAEAITLGESDLFRALQRIPGVSTRDEFSAELWTRGAPWHQTRVLFDGFPLHNPVHGFGLLGGVHPEIVGAATFHPGARPAALALSGGAATLDIVSRQADAQAAGSAELSLASGRLAYRTPLGQTGGVSLALRRTWIDWLTRLVVGRRSDAYVPFWFWDGALRADLDLAERGTLEVSALVERDGIDDDIPDVLHSTRARRGNQMNRVSWRRPQGHLEIRGSLGGTWFGERVDSVDTEPPTGLNAPRERPHRLRVHHARAEVEVAPRSGDSAPPWRAGVSLLRERVTYQGPLPFPAADVNPGIELAQSSTASRASAWVDARVVAASRFTADAGVRMLAGPAAGDAASFQLAPRVSVRFEIAPDAFITAAGGRALQTTQSYAPLGPWVGELAHWGVLWTLARDSVPLLRTAYATLGGEAWLRRGWLVSATVWQRNSQGLATLDPRAGSALDRSVQVQGSGDARGFELGMRRIEGRITGSLAGHLLRSRVSAAGIEVPSPAEQEHAVKATLAHTLSRAILIGAAFTYTSGAPYRRAFIDTDVCNPFEAECGADAWVVERAGTRRGPVFAGLDVMFEWSGNMFGLGTSVFVQVRNALARNNPGAYRSTSIDCTEVCGSGLPVRYIDEFGPGLPTVPVLGVRAAF